MFNTFQQQKHGSVQANIEKINSKEKIAFVLNTYFVGVSSTGSNISELI